MGNVKIVLVFLFFITFISCGKSHKERALQKYNLAAGLCEKGDSLAALQELDSIPVLFPEAFEAIGNAKYLGKKINSEMLFRKQDQLDKITGQLTELEKLFVIEKTEFDRFAQFIPKAQNFGPRWNTSYLQVHLNELGDYYISSNYYGSEWLNHLALRVCDGAFQAKTDTVELKSPNNYHSDFMSTHWEKVSYKEGKDNGVIQFIADNANKNLKAAFVGKRTYSIVLEQRDKQAIRDALSLSNLLKSKTQLEKDIKAFQQKVK